MGGLVLVGLTIGAWHLAVVAEVFPTIFPGPSEAAYRFWEMSVEGYRGTLLHLHLWASISKALVAVGLAVMTGVPIAMWMSVSPWTFGLTAPAIYFVRALPPLGYYSLLITFFGIGDFSKIFLLYLAALPPIVIASQRAVTSLSQVMVETARALGSAGLHYFSHFLIPAISSGVFGGIRLALGFAFTTIVAAEIVAADSGIGWVILDASRYLQLDVVLVAVTSLGMVALVMDTILGLLERRLKGQRRAL